MKHTLFLAVIGFTLTTPVMADNNGASIDQTVGNHHFASINQSGTRDSQAHIEQWGNNNRVGRIIPGAPGGVVEIIGISQQGSNNVFARVSQIGVDNEANILQWHATNSTAEIVQLDDIFGGQASSNRAWLEQHGLDNDALIHQGGSNNYASTGQVGEGGGMNIARTRQYGINDSALIGQVGSGHQAFITQNR